MNFFFFLSLLFSLLFSSLFSLKIKTKQTYQHYSFFQGGQKSFDTLQQCQRIEMFASVCLHIEKCQLIDEKYTVKYSFCYDMKMPEKVNNKTVLRYARDVLE